MRSLHAEGLEHIARPSEGAEVDTLRVENLRTYFYTHRGIGKAVDGVSFRIHPGERLGLIGESGSGKSVTALSILGLNPKPASKIVEGAVWLGHDNLLAMSNRELRSVLGARASLIMQDAGSALNPTFTIGFQLTEAIRKTYGREKRSVTRTRIAKALEAMQLPFPMNLARKYPHQLSGGMRQRVLGAIAFVGDPELIIADEPTTALDVTVQLAYLDHLKTMQERTRASVLFITHDLGVAAEVCDRVVVMYAGKVVEMATTKKIIQSPAHPYTAGLLSSFPKSSHRRQRLSVIEGSPLSIYAARRGCSFAARCPFAQFQRCPDETPSLREVSSGHTAACHYVDEIRSGHVNERTLPVGRPEEPT